jgi:hypothetical protein
MNERISSISTMQHFQPIYVIGDSHVLPYQNVIFQDPWAGGWFVTRTKYISGLTCHDLFKNNTGEFHPGFIQALEYEGLVRNGKATHLSREEIDFNISVASGRPLASPLIILTCGDIDIRAILLPMLKDKYDFVPPFSTPYPQQDRPVIAWDIFEDIIQRHLTLFASGLKTLRESGFNRIYVQLVSPPTMLENSFFDLHGYSCPAAIRYKVVYAFNQLLMQHCKQLGVQVLDIWSAVTSEHYLKPEFELDGVHLTPDSTMLYLGQMLDHAINHQWEATNYVRHELYYRKACNLAIFNSAEEKQTGTPSYNLEPAANVPPATCTMNTTKEIPGSASPWVFEAVKAFKELGICVLKTDRESAMRWKSLLVFDRDVENFHSAWDWSGPGIAPYCQFIQTAEPPKALLDEVSQLLSDADYEAFFQGVLDCPMMVGNLRAFKSSPHQDEGIGPQSWHEDGTPAGIIRGVLYLTDVDETNGPFEYKDSNGIPQTVTGKAGDFLVFDAMRLNHRAMPPKDGTRCALDFVFMPRLAEKNMTIITAGLNHWPVDPFSYTVPNNKSSYRNGQGSTNTVSSSASQSESANEAWVNECTKLSAKVSALYSEVSAIHASRSWKITKPLRWVVTKIRPDKVSST